MTKRPHPADEFNAKVIADAVEWTAFTQAGGRITERFNDRPAAEAAAQRLANQFRRPALVYAISAEGRSALAATINPQKETPAMTSNATAALNGAQIAQLSAILTGGGFKRANSRDAAEKRFRNLAADSGIDADKALRLPFEQARSHVEYMAKIAAAGLNMREADEIAASHPEDIEAAVEAAPAITARLKRRAAADLAVKAGPADAEKVAAKAVRAPKAPDAKPAGKRAAVLEAAQRGEMPAAPDFSAPTHARFRKKLDEVVALAKAGDIEGLRAFTINPVSTSPKAIDRYRNLCVLALGARARAPAEHVSAAARLP